MGSRTTVSIQTSRNWLIDVGLIASGLLAALSGIYFLFFPVGGYQGGRNPMYGITLLFQRHTWDDIHTWTGTAMIAIAVIHLAYHWSWVKNMAGRMVKIAGGNPGCMNRRSWYNLSVNFLVAASFVLTAVSGLYFLLFPSGHGAEGPAMILSRYAWDMIHTWAGVTLISAAVIHFAIHWKWVTKVTTRLAESWFGYSQSGLRTANN